MTNSGRIYDLSAGQGFNKNQDGAYMGVPVQEAYLSDAVPHIINQVHVLKQDVWENVFSSSKITIDN